MKFEASYLVHSLEPSVISCWIPIHYTNPSCYELLCKLKCRNCICDSRGHLVPSICLDRLCDCFRIVCAQQFAVFSFTRFSKAKALVPGASNKLGDDWLTEWLITYSFLYGLAQQWACEKNKIWLKGSLGDEDDARTSNTCIAQRNRAIPHSMLKNRTCLLYTSDAAAKRIV